MAEFYEYINNTGVIVPDTADLRATVESEYKAAFGDDLDVSPSTPQGVLITAETLARDSVVRNNAALANQINPNLAGGKFKDAICALTGLFRDEATHSLVAANITGVAGAVVPAGSQASTAAGAIFESIADVVIGLDGTAVVQFRAVELGPIAAGVGALNQILDNVLGWESVTNPDAATLGQLEQSDASLGSLRVRTLALQGVALPEAIISALSNVEGVKSLKFRENVTSATAVIDGISLVEHSIYVCVDGGSDADVASTILATKSLGADFNGTTTVVVIEPSSGQPYSVKFSRPTEINIEARVTIRVVGTLIDPVTAVKEAMVNYANGDIEGEEGFVVGGPVSTWELSGAVNRNAPGIYVQNMETKVVGVGSFANVEIPIGIDEVARLIAANVTVILA